MYVIPNLVSYNFKTDRFPKLAVRNIGEAKDLQMWAAAMKNLSDAHLIQIDDPTEQWIRKQMDMPRRTTPYKTLDTASSNGTTTPTKTKTGNVGKSPSSGQ